MITFHRSWLCIFLLSLASPAFAADTPYVKADGGWQTTTPVWLVDPGTGLAVNPKSTPGSPGYVQTPIPAGIVAGQIKVATTATAVCLSAAALVNGIVVKALTTNTAAITVGGSGVTATIDGTGNGYILQPGEAMSFAIPNASLACINGAAAAGASYAGN